MEDTHKAVLRPKNPGESLKVQESVLQRRDRNLKAARKRADKVMKIKKAKKAQPNLGLKSAAKMLQNRKIMKQERGRLKTQAKKGTPKVTKVRAMLLVVRNAREGGGPDMKAKLKELGLAAKNRAVFMRNTEATQKELATVKPFCFWGPPTLQTVTDLLHKKAHIRGTKEEPVLPLQDNRVIEDRMGSHGLLCVEDIVDSIYKGQDNFDVVQKFLLPMQFADIRTTKGLSKQVQHVFGDLKKGIDAELEKLLG
jgi:large subunit ribosomal protein L7e